MPQCSSVVATALSADIIFHFNNTMWISHTYYCFLYQFRLHGSTLALYPGPTYSQTMYTQINFISVFFFFPSDLSHCIDLLFVDFFSQMVKFYTKVKRAYMQNNKSMLIFCLVNSNYKEEVHQQFVEGKEMQTHAKITAQINK